jgi:acyl-CoA synthetase (NDP forming)
MKSLEKLLNPRSIAVIGASNDSERIGGRPLKWLIERGFGERIYPVNPTRETVQGVKAYPSILQVPGEVDCAIIALPVDAVLGAARECAAKGVGSLVIFSAGFAEAGPAGASQQAELVALAESSGMRILGPNCLGVFNAELSAFMTFSSWVPPVVPGWKFAVVSQSGAYAAHILRLAERRGLAVGRWVSTGNEADVEVGEVVAELAMQPDVGAIFVYIEGVRSREKFLHALRLARERRVPIVVIKAGTTTLGAEAAISHTASLVGSDSVYDAIFRSHGAFRAESTEEALDVIYALSRGRLPVDAAVAVLTVSGGVGVQIADYLDAERLELPALSVETQAGIKALSPQAATRNPIDLTGHVTNDPTLIVRSLDLILERENIHSVFCFMSILGLVPHIAASIVRALAEVAKRHPQCLRMMTLVGTPEVTAQLEATGCLVFEEPRRAVRALGALRHFALAFAESPAAVIVPVSAHRLRAGQRFNEHEAKQLIQSCGIRTPDERVVQSAQEAAAAADAMGYPVALKVVSADIAHKTDVGGVALNLRNAAEVAAGLGRMADAVATACPDARVDGYLVSRMVDQGVECVLGVTADPVFGPVVMFGLGGIFVEVLNDVAVRLAPLSEADAMDMIRETSVHRLLEGYRGSPPSDLEALAHAIASVSQLAALNADCLKTLEINPLRVMPRGHGVVALDAVVSTTS